MRWAKAANHVKLYAVLGGGWETEQSAHFASASTTSSVQRNN